jgi:hypothetical protein
MVRGTYDLQKLRIEMGNRLCAAFRVRLGIAPGESEASEDNEDAAAVLDQLRAEFKKITDGIKKELPPMSKFTPGPIISSYTELCLVAEYLELEANEAKHFRRLGGILEEFPIYVQFLRGVKGCGPAMAGVILSEFDITKAKYPSSLWQYAGLGVEKDGRGTSKRKEHLVTIAYTDKDGKPAERVGIRHNNWLKTKLLGVLAGSFLRSGSPYRACYDNYKHRLESSTGDWSERSKLNRHRAALRYMVKMFLVDLYKAWRPLEGLTVHPSYQEAKLGHTHGSPANL